ncbi:hypothetical protein CFBP498_44010 [Xanthomonas hortorum pv. vitians]|uniref:AAA family ATPase n=3 Tax=Xanthomonas hortorum TaxID=56454 RepID=A0A6V7F8S3_9XANT|nr:MULTISPECIES: ATP-binding protein [Xanthomonas]MCE4304306.1 AAA family ATPase [Xanthomonas hortorum pv. vitians]MDT7822564.1 AAA family ATPase [Xanthomonas hortorum pv. vitians]MDV7248041.1 AAA family ATPase [Xanthomonas hortorum pv. vitians]MDX6081219.1 AAA family ATPase [Xanthomonas campestris pv. incanae]MDX6087696.1 AAA family ATPase [Xanthomonas campestris pv. incanae]
MKLIAFKVEQFRSIATTGWLPFSTDGVTALVGQNESGKSAILDALHAAFGSEGTVSSDDFRRSGGLSAAALRLLLTEEELAEVCAELPGEYADAVAKKLIGRREDIVFISRFVRGTADDFKRAFRLEPDLQKLIEAAIIASMPAITGDDAKVEEKPFVSAIVATFRKTLWQKLPLFVLFREENSYLPNTVDIDESSKEWLEGSEHAGADNFLVSAGITLKELLVEDDRERASVLSAGVRLVNSRLADYWRQVLGQRGKIKIEVEFARHPPSHARAGAAYLRFWISEGEGEKLHPSQRSKGTRWYVAFFLHLTASQKDGDAIVLLLDEPGAYLHATAQEDVLRLIENLGGSIPVLYSTHSPYLIDHKRIDRILAVERDVDDEDSNTIVRTGLALAASSQLTLAPVLAVMGTDLSTQQLIQRKGNILLEENSAYFYFSALVILTGKGQGLSLVACNGADNVKVVADLLTAWRLDFKAALDEDDKGKRVARQMRDKWQLNADDFKKRILLFKGCAGIEDAFSAKEFAEVVASGHKLGTGVTNSKRVEAAKLSKPLLAHRFFVEVSEGRVTREQLDNETLERFSGWLEWMER